MCENLDVKEQQKKFVKLFLPKFFFGPDLLTKILLYQKFFVAKNFLDLKFLGPTFLLPNIFLDSKFLTHDFFDLKYFGTLIFWS